MSAVAFMPPMMAAPFPMLPMVPAINWAPSAVNMEMANARRFPVSAPAAVQGAYGVQNVGVQSYLPVNNKRTFSWAEKQQVSQGLQRWWPKLFASYGTPAHQLLASPGKAALLVGGLFALVGMALGGHYIEGENKTISALAGGLISGGLGSVLGYFGRQQKNENMLDLMERFPEGATRRDILSDPVYQADLNRGSMASAASVVSNNMSYPYRPYSSSLGRPSTPASASRVRTISRSTGSVSRGGGGRGGGGGGGHK